MARPLCRRSAGYQNVFNAETSNPFYRPTEVAVSSDRLYCSLFKDDMVGRGRRGTA